MEIGKFSQNAIRNVIAKQLYNETNSINIDQQNIKIPLGGMT